MKIIKNLTIFVVVFAILSLVACGGIKEIVLKKEVSYRSRNSEEHIMHTVDLEKSGISESKVSKISVTAEDPEIITYNKKTGQLKTGNKLGRTIITISAYNKEVTLEVNIIKMIDLEKRWFDTGELTKEEHPLSYQIYWAARSLLNCIQDFKYPNSVEVVNCWAVKKADGDYSYFIYNIRAMNGFGGYVIQCMKIYKGGSSIYTASEPQYGVYDEYEEFYGESSINELLKDYFE